MNEKSRNRAPQGILDILKAADTRAFRPVVFWSINSDLKAEELVRQIGEMRSFHLGGFVFHARAGLTAEYLSEEWFSCVGLCLDEAERQGLHVWMYDEFGWPSGFAGGKLLEREDFRACYLEYRVLGQYDESAYAVYALEGGTPRLLRPHERAEEYHTLYVRRSDAYTDILNPEVTEAFLRTTYEPYFARFGDKFGKTFLGFFTDEPQYYRYATPISKCTEEEYLRAYGTPLREELLYLFLQGEKGYPFRVKYYNLMSRLYCENYYKKLQDWCSAHGCMLTGHSVEETFFFTQMWGGADCAASYLYEHVPAMDNLTRSSPACISAKNVGSVAAQTGKKLVLTETFGCSGYAATPRELRRAADRQYVCGVDLMCQHLYNYSLAGQGKTDHPISFGRTLPWRGGYADFNDYYASLGWLIANSEEQAPVAVITPMESIYLDYLRLDERQSQKVDAAFLQVLDELRKAGTCYHFVDEKVLQKLGSVEGGKLRVGERAYSAVVLGNCRELKKSTAQLMRAFAAAGGRIDVMGSAPEFLEGERADFGWLKSGGTPETLPRPRGAVSVGIDYTVREIGGKRFVFAVNEGDLPQTIRWEKKLSLIDLQTMRGYAPQFAVTVPAHSSALLEEEGAYATPAFTARRTCSLVPELIWSDANCLTVENVTVRTESGEELSGYAYGVYETLIRRGYRGKLFVQYLFQSDAPRTVLLSAEKQDVSDERFNGSPVTFVQSGEDVNFKCAQVQAQAGENVYSFRAELSDADRVKAVLFDGSVPESLRNCFSYATRMEPICLFGEFDTEGFCLHTPCKKSAGDLTAQGFANFCGCVRYKIAVEGEGRARFVPKGSFAMCEFDDGENSCRVLLGEGAELMLRGGRQEIAVRCYSTMRNRFGPFHLASGEEDAISPDSFTLRGGWKDERTNGRYTPQRRVLPFGLDSVEVQFEK